MSLYKYAAAAAILAAIPGCLAVLGAQRADASPTSERGYVFYSDATKTVPVGEGQSTCYQWSVIMVWGHQTPYWDMIWEELCYDPNEE